MQMASHPLLLILLRGYFFGQLAKLARLDHLVIHHADKQFLDGAAAEAIDQLARGLNRHTPLGIDGAVVKGPAAHLVSRITLFLQILKNGADRGFLQVGLARSPGAAHLRGTVRMLPDIVHEGLFEGSQRLSPFTAMYHSITVYSTTKASRQEMIEEILRDARGTATDPYGIIPIRAGGGREGPLAPQGQADVEEQGADGYGARR